MKTKLFKHQQQIVDMDPKKTGLFLGTGSGKTRTALCLAKKKTLVICPKTQKEDRNWEREAQEAKISVDLTVVSKETFRKIANTLHKFDTIIVDEAHTCLGATPNVRWRNRQPIPKTSQLFEALCEYIERHSPERVYLVTATIVKSPMTVWAAAKVLGQEMNFYQFRDQFYTKLPTQGREIFVPKMSKQHKELLAKFVQGLGYVGRLQDYVDVPEQSYKTIYVGLSDKQKRRIKELETEFPDPIVKVGKQHQVENGVLSSDEFNDPEEFDTEKVEKLLELAVEFPRLVVFARYTAQIAQIRKILTAEGYKVLVLDGSTKDREKLFQEANLTEECIVLVQCQISAGWQLGKTKEHPEYFDYDVMVFMSMDFSVVNRIQAEGRILRGDNIKKNLYIDIVTRGGVDQAVHRSIRQKKDFDEKLYIKEN